MANRNLSSEPGGRQMSLYVAVHRHVNLIETKGESVCSSKFIFIQALQQLKHSEHKDKYMRFIESCI